MTPTTIRPADRLSTFTAEPHGPEVGGWLASPLFAKSPAPSFAFRADGTLLHANEAATKLLGQTLRLDFVGRLSLRAEGRWKALGDLSGLRPRTGLPGAPHGGARSLDGQRLPIDRAGGGWALLVFQAVSLDGRDALLATLVAATDGGVEAVRERFGLTPAETRVAEGLLRGRTAQEVGDALAIGLATVRTHMARLYAKTGTRCQGPLVAQLTGLGAA
jgi:DNA-binding CsgD family transcriptional regulator